MSDAKSALDKLIEDPIHYAVCFANETDACSCGVGALCDEARAELAALREALAMSQAGVSALAATIGHPPDGSHPDEAHPRAATWLAERANWEKEVAALRERVARLEAALVKADEISSHCEAHFVSAALRAKLDAYRTAREATK